MRSSDMRSCQVWRDRNRYTTLKKSVCENTKRHNSKFENGPLKYQGIRVWFGFRLGLSCRAELCAVPGVDRLHTSIIYILIAVLEARLLSKTIYLSILSIMAEGSKGKSVVFSVDFFGREGTSGLTVEVLQFSFLSFPHPSLLYTLELFLSCKVCTVTCY